MASKKSLQNFLMGDDSISWAGEEMDNGERQFLVDHISDMTSESNFVTVKMVLETLDNIAAAAVSLKNKIKSL